MNFKFNSACGLKVPRIRGRNFSAFFLTMKLTTVFLLSAALFVYANAFSQKVTLSERNSSLKHIFNNIKAQTGYFFFYDDVLLSQAKPVTIQVKGTEMTKVLELCFQNQPLTYSIVGKTVVIKPNPLTESTTKNLQQSIDIHGRVLDENGAPIGGLTISEKGTKNATATQEDGSFILRKVQEKGILVFTGVSVVSREIQVDGRTNLGNIVLESKVIMGEEIVIKVNTGYQTLSRERATGAFEVIGKNKIESRVFTNVTEVLEGQATGVSTYQGKPVIRGNNTFSTAVGTSPLLVIDGLPTERHIDDVNVNDIETITVLKDAAAASIYGVRAANGVVVITTKGGKLTDEPLTSLQFTSDWRWVQNPSLRDFHYATTGETIDYELAVMQRDAARANRSEKDNLNLNLKGIGEAGSTSNSINYYTPLQMARLELLNGTISQAEYDALLGGWRSKDYRQEYMDLVWQTPLRQSYNLSLNSSGKKQSTFASLNYTNNGQQSKYANNQFVKGYIKSTQELNEWLSFDIGSDIQYNNRENVASAYENITMLEPYTSILDENGKKVYRDYVEITGMQGPLHINPEVLGAIEGLPQFESYRFNILDELNDNRITRNNLNVRNFVRLNFKLSENLRYSTSGEYEFTKNKTEDYRSKDSYYYRFLRNRFASNSPSNAVIPEGGRLSSMEVSANSWVWRNQLDFEKSFGLDHQVTATGGIELREMSSNIPISSVYYGYDPVALTYTLLNTYDIVTVGYRNSYIYNNKTGIPGAVPDGNDIKIADSELNPNLNAYKNRYVGAYAVAGYTYKGKYSLSGSMRVDQTNLFGADPRYRYRPLWSAGVKWNMVKEDFMQAADWINLLDFRMSYGLTGNVDQTTTPFLVASLSNQSTYTAVTIPYASISSAPNPMLRWEKTTSYNAGFDYNLFRGLLSGKLDVYYKRSEDLLGSREVHFTSGYTTQRVNSGIMSNKGIELAVSSPWYRKQDLTLSSTLLLSYNKNTVTTAYFNPTRASHLAISGYLVDGKPFDALYAYRYGGLTSGGIDYQNGVPIIYRADGSTMHHFQDNGTLLLDNSASMGVEDVLYMGTKTPLVHASLNQNIRYKNFELAALFLYYGGHKMYKPSFSFSTTNTNYEDWIAKSWTPENPERAVPKAMIYYEPGINVTNVGSLSGMYIRSTKNITSADFIRLRNISLSYTLPSKVANSIKLDRLRISGQINNPWIWSAAGKEYDAEVQVSASNSATLSNWGLPTPTTYFLRFDATF